MKMKRSLFSSRTGFLLLTLVIGGATNVSKAWADDGARTPQSKLMLDLGFYAETLGGETALGGSVDIFVFSPVLSASYFFSPSFEGRVDWGAVHSRLSGGGDSDDTFKPGNPFLSGWLKLPLGRNVVARVGGGIAIPAAYLSDDEVISDVIAYSAAAGMRGWWDSWLWTPETLTLVLPGGRIEAVIGNYVVLGGDVDLGILFPVKNTDTRNTEVTLQFGGDVAARMSVVDFGLAIHAVWLATRDEDNFQASLEPFVRATFDNFITQLRLTMNLDEPLGFSFQRGSVWGVHVGVGMML